MIRARLRREITTSLQVTLKRLVMTVFFFSKGKLCLPFEKAGSSLRTPLYLKQSP
jgi:hypothetical protein